MTWQKTITPGETVGLKLSAAERKLIVDCLYVMDSRLQERVRHSFATAAWTERRHPPPRIWLSPQQQLPSQLRHPAIFSRWSAR